MHVRRAGYRDLDRLVDIWTVFMEHQRELGRKDGKDLLQEFKEDAPDIVMAYFKRNIRSPKGLLLVLDDGKLVQGYMLSRMDKNIPVFKNDMTGYVSDIYVQPEFRGEGWGSLMWEKTLEWFGSKGINEISLQALIYNPDATKIYESWGFRHVLNEMRLDIR